MDKIVITGASGFVGQNIIPYLSAHNFEVVSLCRNELSGDDKLKNSSAVIHLAGIAHDVKNTTNPTAYYEVNFELTKKLFDAFLLSDAKKFIFISSVKAAADVVDGILTEDTPPQPETHYGKSKLMAEEYIQNQPLPAGKFYYILRPCMIHGLGNKGNLNLLYQFVQKGMPYPLAAFDNKRSFLSVKNLCFVIKSLLEKDIPSGIYNVADDEALSTNEVVVILANSLNKEARLWNLSIGLIKLMAHIGTILRLPLNNERLTKLTESYVVSNAKLKKALATELPISAKQGLLLTAKSFNKV